MSFARDRGLFGSTLKGVGVLGCRPLGCGGPAVRLPGSIPGDFPSFQCAHSPSQLLPVFHQGIGSERCGSRPLHERSNRTGSSFSRLLQPPVCYPQGHRGLAACDRPLPSQPVCLSLPFSHGDSAVGPPVSASWGLDGVSGLEGRVPSGSCASGVLLLPEILCRGGGLSILRALLWPFECSAGVHLRHGPDFVDYASSRVLDPEVPRRLASPRVLVPGSGSGEGLSPLALPGARCPGQPGEELSDSHSDHGLPGDAVSDASFEGFPDPQTCPEARISGIRLHFLSSAASGSLASAVGGHVVSGVDRSGVSAPDAVSSAASELRRPSSSRLGQRFLGCLLPRGSSVVVRRVPSSRRSSTGSLSSLSFAVHRRLGFRLGCLPRRRSHVRLVVSPLFQLFDKPPGAPCGPLRGSRVSSPSHASVRQPVCGQHHRFGILEEPGRHPLLSPQFGGTGDLTPLRGTQGSVGAPVHSRAPECSGGLPESSVTGPRVGMDPLFSSLPGPPSVAGDFRPLRHFVEPSPSCLLLADGGSAVSGHGCDDAAVGWSSGLCLPSLWPSPVRHREGPAVSGVGAHVGSSILASTPLVSRPSGASGGCPSVPSTSEGSTQTASLPSFPPEPPRASSDCVSYIERSARTFGFSSAVARQLAPCRHSSTRVNYQAKWAVYGAWCARHGHSVSWPTVPKVA